MRAAGGRAERQAGYWHANLAAFLIIVPGPLLFGLWFSASRHASSDGGCSSDTFISVGAGVAITGACLLIMWAMSAAVIAWRRSRKRRGLRGVTVVGVLANIAFAAVFLCAAAGYLAAEIAAVATLCIQF